MAKNKKKERMVIFLLIGVVLLMAIGFAAYSSNLNISGNVTVSPSNWSVHFKTAAADYSESTGSVTATAHSVTNTDFTFSAALAEPGDFYEATVTVINDGTIAAKLTKITMSSLNEAQSKYLKYTVSYNGTNYNVTTDNLSTALAVNGTATVKVRVEYVFPDSENDLPQGPDPVNVTVTGRLDYAQATN